MKKTTNINFSKEYQNEIQIMVAFDRADLGTKEDMLEEIEKYTNLQYLARLMKATFYKI